MNREQSQMLVEQNIDYLIPILKFEEYILERGEGSYVWDVDGNKYLDLNAGQFCTVFGHSNKEILERVQMKQKTLQHTHTGMLSREVLEAAKNLHYILDGMDAQSIFLTTGAEAIEFCLRYAKHIKKKPGVVCFNKGYHGLSLAAQSVTYGGVYAYPHIPNIYPVSIPNTYSNETEIKQYLIEFEKVVMQNHTDIAVVLMEPIVSVGGMHIVPQEYFQGVRKICDQYDILLAFDECQTGFGRTGTWCYYEQIGCIPDILILAKGIGAGYPAASVSFKRGLLSKADQIMTHYSSHQNDPFVAGVINVGINYIREMELLQHIQKKGSYLLQQLCALAQEYRCIKNPRGCGMMIGFDIYRENQVDYREISKEFLSNIMERGIILQATNGGETIRCLPSYMISYEEIDEFIKQLKFILSKGI